MSTRCPANLTLAKPGWAAIFCVAYLRIPVGILVAFDFNKTGNAHAAQFTGRVFAIRQNQLRRAVR